MLEALLVAPPISGVDSADDAATESRCCYTASRAEWRGYSGEDWDDENHVTHWTSVCECAKGGYMAKELYGIGDTVVAVRSEAHRERSRIRG